MVQCSCRAVVVHGTASGAGARDARAPTASLMLGLLTSLGT